MKTSLSSDPQTVYYGLCTPLNCSVDDVEKGLHFLPLGIEVLKARIASLPNDTLAIQLRALIPMLDNLEGSVKAFLNSSSLEIHCSAEDNALDAGAIVVIVFICILAALALLSSLYHYVRLKTLVATSNRISVANLTEEERYGVYVIFFVYFCFFFLFIIICRQENYSLLNTEKYMSTPRELGTWETLFTCFSIPYNTKKLGEMRKGPLDFLNGIR